ncbi:MAG: DUF58 domain-containing protein [Actinomycetia bacterium]|nr:DUF58 domain-containing protein [Actinomycetes bacterium]
MPSGSAVSTPVVTGRLAALVLVGAALTGLAGLFGGAWQAAVVVLVLVAAAYLGDLVRTTRPEGLAVLAPEALQCQVGQAALMKVEFANTNSRSLRARVRLSWIPSVTCTPSRTALVLSAGGRCQETYRLLPKRGGEIPAGPVAVRSFGPLGLAGWQRNVKIRTRLLAAPAFPSAAILPAKLTALAQADGRNAVRQRGEGTEFDSLREYVIGDDRRSIDWRASARSPDLVVRTWQPERDRSLLIVVDCGRLAAARIGDFTRLQRYLDAALLVTALAVHAGETVEVLAFNTKPERQARSRNRTGALAVVGGALTGLTARMVQTDYAALGRDLGARVHGRQSVIVMTSLGMEHADATLATHLGPVAARREMLLADVSNAHPPATLDPLVAAYRAAASAKAQATLTQARAKLQAHGIASMTAPADQFASDLADTYLHSRGVG